MRRLGLTLAAYLFVSALNLPPPGLRPIDEAGFGFAAVAAESALGVPAVGACPSGMLALR